MPIRPENAARYPANWKTEVRPAILARAAAGHEFNIPCCEQCGVPNGVVGYHGPKGWVPCLESECGEEMEKIGGTVYRAVRIVLTIAHLDHTPENCASSNLRAWCQKCHNAYDAPVRAAGIKARRMAACAVGDLFDDGETGLRADSGCGAQVGRAADRRAQLRDQPGPGGSAVAGRREADEADRQHEGSHGTSEVGLP